MSSEDKIKDAEKFEEERASNITKRAEEVVQSKNLDAYLKERWMLGYIRDVGSPFMYDMMMYKQLAVFVVSFISLFIIGSWGFILMFGGALGLFVWEFFDRLNNAKKLIREMGGHEKAANLISIFNFSYYTEGLPEWQLKKLNDYTKLSAEVRGRLEVLDRAEKIDKNIKNDTAHKEKKEDLLKMRKKVYNQQQYFIFMFCMHIYGNVASKIKSIR